MTVLPSRFGDVRIFDGLAEALLTSEPLECRLVVEPSADGPILTANYHVLSPDGEIVLAAEGLEAAGSESLNRLAVGTASTDRYGVHGEQNGI